MIHQYKSNGHNIVLDVNSGSVHVVDELVYDILALYETESKEEITGKMLEKYQQPMYAKLLEEPISEELVCEAFSEIEELKEQGTLFTEDIYRDYVFDFKSRKTVVKALCLHIAHDCNLGCKYCFAEEGEYKGRRAMMSYEVGKKALDFLIANSGERRNLEVDFFGGEPTMNFEVVKQLVAYGREQEKIHDKNFRFTLTTNGILCRREACSVSKCSTGTRRSFP